MNWVKTNLSKIPIPLFFGLFIVGFLQILFYFIYIYLPLERISGKNIGLPRDLPTISSILSPGILVGEDVGLEDIPHTFYLDKFNDIKLNLNEYQNKSQFIKSAAFSYVISGRVYDVQHLKDDDPRGYALIVLKDEKGEEFIEIITKLEYESMQINLISFAPSPSKNKGQLSSIGVGDYLILKRSVDILTKDLPDKIEIEAYLQGK